MVQELGLDPFYLERSGHKLEATANFNLNVLIERQQTIMPTLLPNLGLPEPYSIDLTTVSLYDVVVLGGRFLRAFSSVGGISLMRDLDDSGSMRKDDRYDLQKGTIRTIFGLATGISGSGISLKFLNSKKDFMFDNLTDINKLEEALAEVQPGGITKVGLALKEKVMIPMLKKADEKTLERPLLIVIITDGEASTLTVYYLIQSDERPAIR